MWVGALITSSLNSVHLQMDAVVSHHGIVELLRLGSAGRAVGGEEGEDVVAAGADEEDGSGQQIFRPGRVGMRHDVRCERCKVLYLLCHGYRSPLVDRDGMQG